MSYTRVFFIWLVLILIPDTVNSQYCGDTTYTNDEEYIPNKTKYLSLTKTSTARHFGEDTTLKGLIVWHHRFKLKNNYSFLPKLECFNCIVASSNNCDLDTNDIKVPNLKFVWLTPSKCKKFPLFILTANDLKSAGIIIKNEAELLYLKKYSLEELWVCFDKYLTDSLPSFIYNQNELISLHFRGIEKDIYFNDSILNLKKLEKLSLPIDLNDKALSILSGMNLKELTVNRVSVGDISDIQKKLPYLVRLWIKEPLTLEERVKLSKANPNIEIKANIVRKQKSPDKSRLYLND